MKHQIVPFNRLLENFDMGYGYLTGYNRNRIKKLIFLKLRYNNPYSTALQKFNYEKEFFRKTSKFFLFLNLT